MTRVKRSDFPGLRHVVLLIPWMVVGLAARAPIRDNSFLWHVRAGELQLDASAVLTTDPFSYNAPAVAWRTQSWLADIGYGVLERILDLNFVWPLVFVCCLLTLFSLGLIFRRTSRSLVWMAVFLSVSAVVLSPFINPRPSIFSLAIFPLVILAALDRRLWWTLPLLTWVWATVHGAWPLGVLFVLLWAIQQRDWRLGSRIVPMVVVVVFTAHGWGTLEILLDFLRARDALALITEWAPTNLASLPAFLFLAGLVIALALQRDREIRGVRHAVFLLPFLYLTVSSTRSLPLGWLAFSPLISSIANGVEEPGLFQEDRPGRRWINLAISLSLLATPFVLATNTGLDRRHFPVEASKRLTGSRVFHDDVTGGYLIFEFGPQRKVFIDDRAELFGDRMDEFLNIRNASPQWQDIFAEKRFDEALVRVSDPIGYALEGEGWEVVFRDAEFLLLRPPGS